MSEGFRNGGAIITKQSRVRGNDRRKGTFKKHHFCLNLQAFSCVPKCIIVIPLPWPLPPLPLSELSLLPESLDPLSLLEPPPLEWPAKGGVGLCIRMVSEGLSNNHTNSSWEHNVAKNLSNILKTFGWELLPRKLVLQADYGTKESFLAELVEGGGVIISLPLGNGEKQAHPFIPHRATGHSVQQWHGKRACGIEAGVLSFDPHYTGGPEQC